MVEVANQVQNQFPDIARVIRKDFYVDDLLTGSRSVEQAIEIRQKITHVLKMAGFQLRKWASNDPAIISNTSEGDRILYSVNFNDVGETKLLDIKWLIHSDDIAFTFKEWSQSKVTKRQILIVVSHIFDPLGLRSPYIIIAKTLLQELWLHKLSWDESLLLELHSR